MRRRWAHRQRKRRARQRFTSKRSAQAYAFGPGGAAAAGAASASTASPWPLSEVVCEIDEAPHRSIDEAGSDEEMEGVAVEVVDPDGDAASPALQTEAVEADGSEQWFVVERILGERRKRGKVQFLISWKGYDASHDSWEPEENVLDQSLLDAWRARSGRIEMRLV